MSFELVVVGASLGGLRALETVLGGLARGFALPIAIVLHLRADDTVGPVDYLQRRCALAVGEAEDKESIEAGRIYLAPADYHLLVERGSFSLSTEAPVLHARPSIDVLFESAADAFRDGVIGVLLTGASSDGARGASWIKKRGGILIVQDPSTAESPIMPRAAIAAAGVDWILPLGKIADRLTSFSRQSRRAKRKRGERSPAVSEA